MDAVRVYVMTVLQVLQRRHVAVITYASRSSGKLSCGACCLVISIYRYVQIQYIAFREHAAQGQLQHVGIVTKDAVCQLLFLGRGGTHVTNSIYYIA